MYIQPRLASRDRLAVPLWFPLGEDFLRAIERADDRRHYGETRIRAIGVVGKLTLHYVYTQRGEVRRIISLRYANRKERDAYRATYPG